VLLQDASAPSTVSEDGFASVLSSHKSTPNEQFQRRKPGNSFETELRGTGVQRTRRKGGRWRGGYQYGTWP